MTNDETAPLPAEGAAPTRAEGWRIDGANGTHEAAVPPAPPSPWATTQPVIPSSPSSDSPPPPSPYGPPSSAGGWGSGEPDPWIDVTPGRPAEAPAFGDSRPRSAGQGRRVLGVIGLVAAGAIAGALIVSAVDGFGGSNTAAVQPGGVSRNGVAPNGVVPGGGVPGGAQGGVQGGVPGGAQGGVQGGQGLQGGQGAGGEQRVIGTLTGVSTSKLTVRTASGSATYQVVSQTQIVRNGVLASAGDLKVGDRVLVHVFPANGSDGVLERVIAVPGSGTTGSGTQGDGEDTADT